MTWKTIPTTIMICPAAAATRPEKNTYMRKRPGLTLLEEIPTEIRG